MKTEIKKSSRKILNEYKKGTASLETCMDSLADTGMCLNLLNDDNGHWAFAADGYQSIALEKSDVETHFWVEKKYWKTTIKAAFIFFMNRLLKNSIKTE